MKHKSFRNTFFLFVILIIVAGAVYIFDNPSQKEDQQKSSRIEKLFEPVNIDSVSYIKIHYPPSSDIALTKTDGQWRIESDNDYLADQQRVSTMLDVLTQIHSGEIISRDTAKHSLFQVEQEHAAAVSFGSSQDDIFAHFFIGKGGPMPGAQYVRSDQKDTVLLVKSNVAESFFHSISALRDKTVLDFDPQITNTIAMKFNTSKLVFNRNNDVWELEGIQNADSQKIQVLISLLSNLQASDFVLDPESETRYNTEERYAEVKIFIQGDNFTQVLYIGKSDEIYYARLEGSDTIFKITNSIMKEIVNEEEYYMQNS